MQTFVIFIVIGTSLGGLNSSFLTNDDSVKQFSGRDGYTQCRKAADALKMTHIKDNVRSRVMCLDVQDVLN
jgi:hypothetical protein